MAGLKGPAVLVARAPASKGAAPRSALKASVEAGLHLAAGLHSKAVFEVAEKELSPTPA